MLENTVDNSLDLHLLNDFQQNFPLCPAPFAELAGRLGVAETTVLGMLERLRREGRISRVGAVFAPKRIGASSLVALSVPSAKLAQVVKAVNRFPEVNHTLARESRYNLWFVVTAGSAARLEAALGAIEQAAAYPLLRLPMLKEHHASTHDVSIRTVPQGGTVRTNEVDSFVPTVLDELERRLVMALQEGLPLFIRPFSVLASRLGCEESEVLERIRRWCAEGVIKRFGVVVRQSDTAGPADALLVHDIPDGEAASWGQLLAQEPGVSLCYERPRALPDWPYNLFCMVHGQVRDEVCARVAELRQRLKLTDFPYAILFPLPQLENAIAGN